MSKDALHGRTIFILKSLMYLHIALCVLAILYPVLSSSYDELTIVFFVLVASFMFSFACLCHLIIKHPALSKNWLLYVIVGLIFILSSGVGLTINTAYTILYAKNPELISNLDVAHHDVVNTGYKTGKKIVKIISVSTKTGHVLLQPRTDKFELEWIDKNKLFLIKYKTLTTNKISVMLVCPKEKVDNIQVCANIVKK